MSTATRANSSMMRALARGYGMAALLGALLAGWFDLGPVVWTAGVWIGGAFATLGLAAVQPPRRARANGIMIGRDDRRLGVDTTPLN